MRPDVLWGLTQSVSEFGISSVISFCLSRVILHPTTQKTSISIRAEKVTI